MQSADDWGANARSRVEKALARARKTVEEKRTPRREGASRRPASAAATSRPSSRPTGARAATGGRFSAPQNTPHDISASTVPKRAQPEPEPEPEASTAAPSKSLPAEGSALEDVRKAEASAEAQVQEGHTVESLVQQLRNVKAEQGLMEAEARMMVVAVEDENQRLRDEIARLSQLAEKEAACLKDQIAALHEQLRQGKGVAGPDRAALLMHMLSAARRLHGSWVGSCRAVACWVSNVRVASVERRYQSALRASETPAAAPVQHNAADVAGLRARVADLEARLMGCDGDRRRLEDELAMFHSDYLAAGLRSAVRSPEASHALDQLAQQLGEAERELMMLHSCKSDDAQAAREMADSHRRLKAELLALEAKCRQLEHSEAASRAALHELHQRQLSGGAPPVHAPPVRHSSPPLRHASPPPMRSPGSPVRSGSPLQEPPMPHPGLVGLRHRLEAERAARQQQLNPSQLPAPSLEPPVVPESMVPPALRPASPTLRSLSPARDMSTKEGWARASQQGMGELSTSVRAAIEEMRQEREQTKARFSAVHSEDRVQWGHVPRSPSPLHHQQLPRPPGVPVPFSEPPPEPLLQPGRTTAEALQNMKSELARVREEMGRRAEADALNSHPGLVPSFDTLDVNHDGVIDRREFEAGFGLH